jgi:hypothetical protein
MARIFCVKQNTRLQLVSKLTFKMIMSHIKNENYKKKMKQIDK